MSRFPAFDPGDWDAIAPHYTTLQDEPLTADGVPDWLRRWSDLESVIAEAATAASRTWSENTADADAEKAYLHHLQEIAPRAEVAGQALTRKLLAVPEFTPAPDHVQMMRRFRSEAALFRDANVSLQVETRTLANEYDRLAGAMTVTWGGETLTLPQAEQSLLQSDRAAREAAWRAVQTRWLEDREALDALFLKLLALRRRIARNADETDFRAYTWRALNRFDYTPKDSLAFGRAIEAHVVPLAAQRRETRRRRLGLDTLRPWDLLADPQSRPPLRPFDRVGDLEEGVERMLAALDPDLGTQFARLRPGFLDLASRPHKSPGGYCAFFPVTGLPYIFMNAVGTHDDVRTLLHEAGHAFHDLASHAAQSLAWNRGAPAEFAEVASMTMEMLPSPFLEAARGGFYTAEEAARARAEHLEQIIQFLPYMAVVDGFQHWVYAEALEDVTAAQLDACWDALWERFLPGVDWRGQEAERRTGWHRKIHLFALPFYYVEYGLAQMGALQVWRNSLADPAAALRDYRAALALGNTRPLPELFAAAGARLAFDPETVGDVTALVAAHLDD